MTSEEKRYVANQIIVQLNAPLARILARSEGKGATLKSYLRYNFEDVDELLEGDKEDISKMVSEAAKGCRYPDEKIPCITCKLSLSEIFSLSDVDRFRLQNTMLTLTELVEVMQDNEDERAPVLAAALKELRKMTEI